MNQLQTFANSESGAVSNPHVWTTLYVFCTFGGCHHMRLLQPRVKCCSADFAQWNATVRFRLGLTKFQFQLLLGNFAFGSHALHMDTCLSSKGPKPHHLSCYLSNRSVHKNLSHGYIVVAQRQTPLPQKVHYIDCTIDVEKGLRGVHADKSAASICKLRQWRSQQPSCLDYIVLDDRLSVIDCNIICECSVTTTREGFPVVRLKQPATQILWFWQLCCWNTDDGIGH